MFKPKTVEELLPRCETQLFACGGPRRLVTTTKNLSELLLWELLGKYFMSYLLQNKGKKGHMLHIVQKSRGSEMVLAWF